MMHTSDELRAMTAKQLEAAYRESLQRRMESGDKLYTSAARIAGAVKAFRRIRERQQLEYFTAMSEFVADRHAAQQEQSR